jgi:hypothetical protein
VRRRPKLIYNENLREKIVNKRLSGMSIAAIADEIGISQSYASKVCVSRGIRMMAARKALSRHTVTEVLSRYDVIIVERGLTGGYLVTLDDEHTGTEEASLNRAIHSALQAAVT